MSITKYGKKLFGLLAILLFVFVVASCNPSESNEARNAAKEKVNEVLANITFAKPEETLTNLEFAIRDKGLLAGDNLTKPVFQHKYGGTVEIKSSNNEVINVKWAQANVRQEELDFLRDAEGKVIYVEKDTEGKTYYIDAEGKRVNTTIKEGDPVPVVGGLTTNTIYKLIGSIKRPAFGQANANVTVTLTVSQEYEFGGKTEVYSNSKKIDFTVLAESTPVYQGTIAELKAEVLQNYSAALSHPVNFNGTVTAIHYREGQFQVSDNSGGFFVYKIIPGLQIGDLVNVQGNVTQYYGILQVGNNINVTVLGTAAEAVVPTPITLEQLAKKVPNAAVGDGTGGQYFVSEGYFKKYADRQGQTNYHLVDTKGNDIQIYYKSHIVWEEANVLDTYLDKYVSMKYNVYTYFSGKTVWQVSFNLTEDTFVEIEAPAITDQDKVGFAYDLVKAAYHNKEFIYSEVVTLPTGDTNLGASYVFSVKAGDEAKMAVTAGVLTFTEVTSATPATLLVTITVGEATETYELPISINPIKPMTVAEVIAKADGTDIVIAGKVVGWWSTTYYNFYIMDEAGDTILVYGDKKEIAIGDYVVIKGKRGSYQGCPQVSTPWSFISKAAGTVGLPTVKSVKTVEELAALKLATGGPFNQYLQVYAKRVGYNLVDVNNEAIKLPVYSDGALLPAEGTVGTFNIYFYGFSSAGVPRIAYLGRPGEFTEPQMNDAEKVAFDKAALEALSGDIVAGSTFNLITKGLKGSDITWVANPVSLIDAQGVVGTGLMEDAILTLTATLTLGTETATAVVTLNVKANFTYPTVAETRAVPKDQLVMTKGVVTAHVGNNAFIQDATGGIYLYLGTNASFADKLVIGNEVIVKGTRADYANLLQITTLTSVEVVETGKSVDPVVLESLVLADVLAQQGKLVSISGLTVKTIPVIAVGSHYTVVVTDGTVDLQLRVDRSIVDFVAVKEHFEGMVVGQSIDLVALPVSQYNADPQLMVSKVSQLVVAQVSDAEKLAADVAALPTDLGNKTEVFDLPLAGLKGSTITWVVKEGTAVVIVDNVVTTVTRPAADGVDAVVTLTATLTLGTETTTKDVTVKVTKEISGGGMETLIYSTGFEASEGFVLSNVYNNTSINEQGAENQKWGFFYGTPTGTDAPTGTQHAQMRWYTTAKTTFGYAQMMFDLNRITKVEFDAKNTNGLNVKVYYSTDGGTTWLGEELFTLTTASTTYTYNISSTGEYANVRVKFVIDLPTTQPTATSRLSIDDVKVYGIA